MTLLGRFQVVQSSTIYTGQYGRVAKVGDGTTSVTVYNVELGEFLATFAYVKYPRWYIRLGKFARRFAK